MDACPLMDAPTEARFREALKASSAFSLEAQRYALGLPEDDRLGWITAGLAAGRAFFSPWSAEILYAIAVLGEARFGQLQDLLGLSSRTLADRLRDLQASGFVERRVFDEQPVRIEYRLTKDGRKTAALASPLFTHLAHSARGRAAAPARTAP